MIRHPTPHPARSRRCATSPPSPARGEGKSCPFSRRGFSASEFCPPRHCERQRSNLASSPHERSDMRDQHYRRITTRMSLRSSGLRKRVIPKSVVAVFGQDHAQEKGSGTPANALCLARTQAACGTRHGKGGLRRPPLAGALACRRSTAVLTKGTFVPRAQRRARLPERRQREADIAARAACSVTAKHLARRS